MIDMYTRAARSQMIDLPAGRFHYLSWNAEQVDAPGVLEPLDSLLPLLAEIAAPTLLLRSDPARGSILAAAAWEEARSYLSANSRAIQIAGATHTIHWSAFDAWMRSVQAFLEEKDGQKR